MTIPLLPCECMGWSSVDKLEVKQGDLSIVATGIY